MITGMRGVVLLDLDDAAFLAEALQRDFEALESCGIRPAERVALLQQKLAKAVAGASEKGADTPLGVRELGEQHDSAHTAPYDLVDSGEAAKILGCTAANVRDLRRRGRLRGHHAGGRWLYPAASVVELSERRAANRG